MLPHTILHVYCVSLYNTHTYVHMYVYSAYKYVLEHMYTLYDICTGPEKAAAFWSLICTRVEGGSLSSGRPRRDTKLDQLIFV